MAARIISVCNQKGGCGKTTVTMALASAFAARGNRVLVIDGDPQGSALIWSTNAPEGTPFPATVISLAAARKNLPGEVRKHVMSYDVVVIDCPPAVESDFAQASLMIADVALVPLIPSPPDVAAVAPFIKLVQQVQAINPELKGVVVPNLVDKSTNLAKGYLQAFGGLALPTSRARLSRRDAHKKACAQGTSVSSLDREARAEVTALVLELEALMSSSVEPAEAAV
jgi:chromosome partitioning protein